MNTKDEIISAMKGESMDAAPPAIFTQTGTESQMEMCGCFWPEAVFDAEKMATLSVQLSKQYGFATARVPFDLTAEAQTMGCSIKEGSHNTQPAVYGSPWIASDGGIPDVPDLIPVDEFMRGERIRSVIDAAERIGKTHPELFCVTSCIDAPGIANFCLGYENALIGMMMDPDPVLKWYDACLKYSKAYASALSEVSDATMVLVEGDSDTVPPDMFDTFVRPFAYEVIGSVRGFSISHSCGDTSDVLGKLASLGQTALSVDTVHCPEDVMSTVGGKLRLIGGIDPISNLLQGTPETIVSTARRCSEIGFSMIAPECGVPPQTCDRNLYALSHYREM